MRGSDVSHQSRGTSGDSVRLGLLTEKSCELNGLMQHHLM